jgi:hypothetical protein
VRGRRACAPHQRPRRRGALILVGRSGRQRTKTMRAHAASMPRPSDRGPAQKGGHSRTPNLFYRSMHQDALRADPGYVGLPEASAVELAGAGHGSLRWAARAARAAARAALHRHNAWAACCLRGPPQRPTGPHPFQPRPPAGTCGRAASAGSAPTAGASRLAACCRRWAGGTKRPRGASGCTATWCVSSEPRGPGGVLGFGLAPQCSQTARSQRRQRPLERARGLTRVWWPPFLRTARQRAPSGGLHAAAGRRRRRL